MLKWLLPGALLLALALLGCDSQKLMNMFIPDAESKAGKAFVEDIRTGNFTPVLAAVDPACKPKLNLSVLQQLQGLFDGENVEGVKIVGSHSLKMPNRTFYAVTYEYGLSNRWVLVEIVLQPTKGYFQIEGIHAQQMSGSLEQLNAFALSRKSLAHLLFLGAAILVPIFTIWTAIACWRTPIPRRKWLWRIFVLVGIAQFTLNWTTGALNFQPLGIQFLGAGFTQQLYGPLILQLGIPLGAVLFWARRPKWLNNDAKAHTTPPG